MVLTGGGSKSKFWSQMLADLYACPVSGMQSDEGAALGAALLAAVGAGIYTTVQEACQTVVRKGETLNPDPIQGKSYQPWFDLYHKLYLDLKDNFATLASI
jgi:xylulokinase